MITKQIYRLLSKVGTIGGNILYKNAIFSKLTIL